MPPNRNNDTECQGILEALTKSFEDIRTPYDDNMDAEARKAAVEKADHHVDLLNNTFIKLACDIKRDRNCYIAINRLIDELLIEIWSYHDLSDRFSASQVCNRWRRIALSAPHLWGLIDMEDNKTIRLRHLIERSRAAPLHILVGMKRFNRGVTTLFGPSSHPSSFKDHNIRILNTYRPPPIVPSFPPTGLSTEKLPFITRNEFDKFVGRSVTLDALVQKGHMYYVSPESAALRSPMPYLKTLRLIQGTDPGSGGLTFGASAPYTGQNNILPESLPFPLFSNHTPLLRELCFDSISARWEDPIYRNLTNLRLNSPHSKATVTQILRILQACPKMTELELTRCLVAGSSVASEHDDNVNQNEGMTTSPSNLDDHPLLSLPNLIFFQFEEQDHTSAISLLSSLVLPQLEYLCFDSVGIAGSRGTPNSWDRSETFFTDRFGRPLRSIAETIREPTYLCIGVEWGHVSLSALSEMRNPDPTRPLKRASPYISNSRYSINSPMPSPLGVNGPSHKKIKILDREGSLWTIIAPAEPQALGGPTTVDSGEWKAASIALGNPPPPNPSNPSNPHNPILFPTSLFSNLAATLSVGPPAPPAPAMNMNPFPPTHNISPVFGPLSRDIITQLENATLGGLQFHTVEKLQLELMSSFPDFFYRDILTRCSGVKKFKVNFNDGIGILVAVAGDELLPMLEEVYLDGLDGYRSSLGVINVEILADWVEARQRKADGDGTGQISRLKKVIVQSIDNPLIILKDSVRKRMEDALGQDGEFIWRSGVNRWVDLQLRWTKIAENDGEGTDGDPHSNIIDADLNTREVEEGRVDLDLDDVDPLAEEWSLGVNKGRFQGWSAGPW